MAASRAQSCAEAQTFAWGVRALPAAEGKDIAGGWGLYYPGLNCTDVTGLKDVTLASQGDIGGRKRMNRSLRKEKRSARTRGKAVK